MASIWQKAVYSLPGSQGKGEDYWRGKGRAQGGGGGVWGAPAPKSEAVLGAATRGLGQAGAAAPAPTPGGGGGGGGGGAGFGVDSAAAQRTAQANELRNAITGRRNQLNALFDQLLGDVAGLGQARRAELDESFNRETTDAREGFTQKSDELVKTFAGRGLGDSSYRIEGEANAATQFRRALDELGRQNQGAQAQLGQSLAEKNAAITADRTSANQIDLGALADDVEGLTGVRQQIDKMLNEATKQRASLATPEGFRGTLNSIAPAQGQAQALKAQLDALIQSNTPKVVKDSIAEGLIANFGGVDQGVWSQYYQTNDQKPTLPATPPPAAVTAQAPVVA